MILIHADGVHLHDCRSGIEVDDEPREIVALTEDETESGGVWVIDEAIILTETKRLCDAAVIEILVNGLIGVESENADSDGADLIVTSSEELTMSRDDVDDIALIILLVHFGYGAGEDPWVETQETLLLIWFESNHDIKRGKVKKMLRERKALQGCGTDGGEPRVFGHAILQSEIEQERDPGVGGGVELLRERERVVLPVAETLTLTDAHTENLSSQLLETLLLDSHGRGDGLDVYTVGRSELLAADERTEIITDGEAHLEDIGIGHDIGELLWEPNFIKTEEPSFVLSGQLKKSDMIESAAGESGPSLSIETENRGRIQFIEGRFERVERVDNNDVIIELSEGERFDFLVGYLHRRDKLTFRTASEPHAVLTEEIRHAVGRVAIRLVIVVEKSAEVDFSILIGRDGLFVL